MKLTNTITTFIIMTSLCFSSVIVAEDQFVPVITKPAVLQEGTQRVLSVEQIAELIPWAKNSKVFLNDLLSTIAGLSSADKLDRLEDGIKSIVGESAPKNSELLMRYVLNRGLAINDLLKTEISADEVGAIDTKLRVLLLSIKMAITYYDSDMETLNKKTNAPFISFGVQYFNFLTELNKSIFDASASYNIQRTALEWLQWDLYRDLNNQTMAVQIVKINNSLKIYPVKKMSDSQYISYIRQMKLLAQNLDLGNYRPSKKAPVDYDVSNNSTPSVSNGKKANIIVQCGSSFSDPAYRSSCSEYAVANDLDLELIQFCGSELSTNSSRYGCLTLMNGKTATRDNIVSYKNCSSSFSDNAYRVACMKSYNETSILAENIAACGSQLSTNSSRLKCVSSVGELKPTESFVETINTCGSAFSDNDYRNACIDQALKSPVTDDEIKTCGSKLSTNATRLRCIGIVTEKRSNKSTKIIKECGSLMSDNDYRNTCIKTSLTRSLNPSDIDSCSVMTTNSTRLSCLTNF